MKKQLMILSILSLALLAMVSAEVNGTNGTNETNQKQELMVCDFNGDTIRDLSDVAVFASCMDTFDANGDGIHNLVDVSIYASNLYNNTWCAESFICQATGNETDNETDNETIVETDFSLKLLSPTAQDYDEENISIEIEANMTLDSISYEVAGLNDTCENCSELTGELELDEGDYTIVVEGILGNITKEITVSFTVEFEVEDNETDDEENETDDYCDENCSGPNHNESGEPRFDLGFNKLPQMYEAGDVSEEELTDIILENKLNPGILNRLIKTGTLTNETLEAILDTQFKPQGIFRKIMSFFGVAEDGYAQDIYETYGQAMSEKNKQKILTRKDLSNKYKEDIKEKFKEQEQRKQDVAQSTGNNNNPGKAKKTLSVGAQEKGDFVAPGQAKKAQDDSGKENSRGNEKSNSITGKATTSNKGKAKGKNK